MAEKLVAMFYFITSDVLKLEGVSTCDKKLCESPKPGYVKHQVNVPL